MASTPHELFAVARNGAGRGRSLSVLMRAWCRSRRAHRRRTHGREFARERDDPETVATLGGG